MKLRKIGLQADKLYCKLNGIPLVEDNEVLNVEEKPVDKLIINKHPDWWYAKRKRELKGEHK